eukprot:5713646-Pyramimonas_sp.AAC.1
MPCLTATRCADFGYWLSPVGRRINIKEMLNFQGFRESDVDGWQASGISERGLAHMLGNGLSLNVAERVIGRALWSAGLVASRPADRWASSTAWANV